MILYKLVSDDTDFSFFEMPHTMRVGLGVTFLLLLYDSVFVLA